MNWIALIFAIETGVMPLANHVDTSAPQVTGATPAYIETDMQIELFDGRAFVGGYLRTAAQHDSGIQMRNLYGKYEFRAGLRYKAVELGFRHICGPHGFHTYPNRGLERWKAPVRNEHTREEIYLRFETTVGGGNE